ncbi:hypothetical protein ACX40Y_15450 [Sphingomonas sp. RS6]
MLRIFRWGEINAWRDAHVRLARAVLNQAAADLIETLDATLSQANWQDGLIDQTRFVATRVAPVVREVAEPLARRVIDEANRALAAVSDHEVLWRPIAPETNLVRDMFEEVQDWAAAGGTALSGLMRTAAGGLPVGEARVGRVPRDTAGEWMRLRAEQRLRAKVHAYVNAAVVKGPKGRPSILDHVTTLLREGSREARYR